MATNKYRDGDSVKCWLRYADYKDNSTFFKQCGKNIVCRCTDLQAKTAAEELAAAYYQMYGIKPAISDDVDSQPHILLEKCKSSDPCGFSIKSDTDSIAITSSDGSGILHGAFALLRYIGCNEDISELNISETPREKLRLMLQWDNADGSIERGYAGQSIFFKGGEINCTNPKIRDYARLLASVGINGIVLNNVNVGQRETLFITDSYLPKIAHIADIFRAYGIRVYLSVNFAAPIDLGGLDTADPLDENVAVFWQKTASKIYAQIPDFGGFCVKADSENRPGPMVYGRDHAQGANVLAQALAPFGGIVLWRCFVYNCHVDWRDRSTDRAKAAYDTFKPLDGKFLDNVVLQIKNGPVDFQIREPVSPLFGALPKTNVLMEVQITQEYTGQQKHLCFLAPMWKEALDFDTCVKGRGSVVADIVSGKVFERNLGGIGGISNIGDAPNWTGHPLAQANLYAFGRLAWNPTLSCEKIADEWIKLTLGHNTEIIKTVLPMLLHSRAVYENYTSPLGIGWMVKPSNHYGPDVDGYEYSEWGTYHYADFHGIGVERTSRGTGYTRQYAPPIADLYEHLESCPDELLLFFHHVSYTHKLHSGNTVIQHIYDSHFRGVEEVKNMISAWKRLEDVVDNEIFQEALERLKIQLDSAVEWRDVINTYFYRKSGIADEKGRKIYD